MAQEGVGMSTAKADKKSDLNFQFFSEHNDTDGSFSVLAELGLDDDDDSIVTSAINNTSDTGPLPRSLPNFESADDMVHLRQANRNINSHSANSTMASDRAGDRESSDVMSKSGIAGRHSTGNTTKPGGRPKAGSEGSVTMTRNRTLSSGLTPKISISDHGSGAADSVIDAVQESGISVQASTTTRMMGLAASSSLPNAHTSPLGFIRKPNRRNSNTSITLSGNTAFIDSGVGLSNGQPTVAATHYITSIEDLEANDENTLQSMREARNNLAIVEREHTCSSSDDDNEPEQTPSDNLQLRYTDITLGKELGRGGFGVVYAGSLYGSPVAIKMLHSNVADSDEFLNEIDVMRRLRHPNIVLFVGATVGPDPLCIITELVSRGPLMKIIDDKKEPLGLGEIFKFALDIARGMNYLHHSGIVHLDLTPNNILVTENSNCKVGDFGLSKVMSTKAHGEQTNGGTVVYTAPEVYKGERIRTRVDVYSFAVCLWQLYYRKMPYENMNQHAICFNVVAYNKRPDFDENNLPPFTDLIKTSWNGVARLRPTFDQLIRQLEALQRTHINKKPVRAKSDIGSSFKGPSFIRRGGSIMDKESGLGSDPNEWTVDDVVRWCRNCEMDDAVEVIAENGINGQVLLSLTDKDQVALGLNKFGTRRGLQIELSRLVSNCIEKGVSMHAYLYTHHGAIATPTPKAPKQPRVDLTRAKVHINGHACIYILPDPDADQIIQCSVCEDEFQDFERIHKCLTCNLLLHKECASVHECASPTKAQTEKPEDSWSDMPSDAKPTKLTKPVSHGKIMNKFSASPSSRSPFAARRQLLEDRRSNSHSKLRPAGSKNAMSASKHKSDSFTFPSPSSTVGAIVSTGGGMYTPSGANESQNSAANTNSTHARFRGLTEAVQKQEQKDWRRISNVIADKWYKLAKGDSVEKRKMREEKILAVQENVENMLGQVLLAKRESMMDYNNKRFEQSYLKFKASGEAIRRLADVSLSNSTGKPFRNGNEPWVNLNRFFAEPDRIPYRDTPGDEEDDYVVFVTMVRVKLEIALQESSMLLNPELSFRERSDAVSKALDFVLATEDILVDVDPPVTPDISTKSEESVR